MSTIDLTKVAGFKAVDAEGNDMGIVSLSEMTNMVKESIINEAVAMQSVSTLAKTSTLAATDTYEDRLPTSDTFSYVRTLDSSGNPKRTSQNALATVVEGLLPTAKLGKNNGITPKSVGFEFIQIQNSYIKISMSSLYNSLTLAVSMYAGGEVGLFLLSIALSRKTESKCALIGNKRGTKFYVKDKFLYISTTDTTNSHYSITSFSLASQIESVESIPRQEFDDSYYELTVTPIV